jgi:hypothetical protein
MHRPIEVASLSSVIDQIPPDLVVKSQAIDIVGLILLLIQGQNVVETSRRHRKSRFELISV